MAERFLCKEGTVSISLFCCSSFYIRLNSVLHLGYAFVSFSLKGAFSLHALFYCFWFCLHIFESDAYLICDEDNSIRIVIYLKLVEVCSTHFPRDIISLRIKLVCSGFFFAFNLICLLFFIIDAWTVLSFILCN